MNIKEILKNHKITQEEFAEYMGITREGLNKNLNHNEPTQSMIDCLKFLVAKKRGIILDVDLS